MPGGGGGDVARSRTQAMGRRRRQTTSLPLDVIAEIAASSDPATLVRCAATRLRLRHADDRFVPSLLRGHLIKVDRTYWEKELYLVDTTAADGTARKLRAADVFPPGPNGDGEPWDLHAPLAAREGLLLVRTATATKELRVCDPATGRGQTLPPEPTSFAGQYVLLVLKANLVLSDHRRYLQLETFSSEHGAWGPCTEIRTPHLHGKGYFYQPQGSLGKAVVVGGDVHWLCLTTAAGYVLKLHVETSQVTLTKLPATVPGVGWQVHHLLAATSPGGRLVVLVTKEEKISAWVQPKHTPAARWKQQPEVVIEHEAIWRFAGMGSLEERRRRYGSTPVYLEWFAERSGVVLVRMQGCGYFLLDLRSMEIVRWFSVWHPTLLPYEMDLANWAPTFTSDF
ncbi:hypothetical protein ACP70R_005199 [Stipagrostis hirtigluma subsp. patula]